MALRGAAARRYAQAVFDIGKQSNSLDRWLADLNTLNATFGEHSVVSTLEDPNLNEDEQRKVIDGVLKPGAVSDLARNLLYLLVRRQRLGLLPRIVEVFQEMYNKEKGVVVAEVTSAVPLDPVHKQRVADELSKMTGGKKVDLRVHEDPRILGGIIARIGDELIDASIATRLAELSERLA